MKSTVLCKHPRLGDEFCVASPVGIRWYRCSPDGGGTLEGLTTTSSSHRSDGDGISYSDFVETHDHHHYQSDGSSATGGAEGYASSVGCRLMGDASMPSWLLRDVAPAAAPQGLVMNESLGSKHFDPSPASSSVNYASARVGGSTGGSTSGGGAAAVLTAAMSSETMGRLCLVGLDSGAIVAARWSADDVASAGRPAPSLRGQRGPGGRPRDTTPAGWSPQTTPTTAAVSFDGRPIVGTTPPPCHKSMDILVSLTHQRPVVSAFLDTVNPALFAVGGDQGSVMLYDVSSGTGNAIHRRRSFGQYAEDEVLPLVTTSMPGRCTALEAVLSSPLVVVASKQLLSSGGTGCLGGSSLGAVAAEFTSVLIQRSHSGQQLHSGSLTSHGALCGSSGPMCSSGGSTSAVERVRFGATPTVAQPTYTMQLQDLRAPAGSTTIFGISDGGGTGCVSSSGNANHATTNTTTTATATTRMLLAERIAVHPSQPLIATCGTFRGTSRRHRKRTEVVQLWDVRQPSTPIRVLRATCAPHVSLRWKPSWEPELLGVTTHDIRLWKFADNILDDEATITATGFESGTEAGTEEGWLSNYSDQPGDTTGPTTMASAASDSACPPPATVGARSSGPRKSRHPSPVFANSAPHASGGGSGVVGGGSAMIFDSQLYGHQTTSGGSPAALAAPFLAEWMVASGGGDQQQASASSAQRQQHGTAAAAAAASGGGGASITLGSVAVDPLLLVVDKQGVLHVAPFWRGVLHAAAPSALLAHTALLAHDADGANLAGTMGGGGSLLPKQQLEAGSDEWMLLSSGRNVWLASVASGGAPWRPAQQRPHRSLDPNRSPTTTTVVPPFSGTVACPTAKQQSAGGTFDVEHRVFNVPCLLHPSAAAAALADGGCGPSPSYDAWSMMQDRMRCAYTTISCHAQQARRGEGQQKAAATSTPRGQRPPAQPTSLPSRHPNRFTAERCVALPTLLSRRELPAYYAMRYTLLVRECQEAQTLPVARAPPGLMDLVKGAVGPSAHSLDSFSTCFVTPVGGHYCTWRALDDPLRVFVLKAMAWLPEARVDNPPSGGAAPSSRTPPTSSAASASSTRAAVGPRLSGIDLAGDTRGMAEAVERRVGIALVLGQQETAVAMLQHYAALDKSYGAIAGMVLGLLTSQQPQSRTSTSSGSGPSSSSQSPTATGASSPASSATQLPQPPSVQHTTVLHHCGGFWFRTLLTLSVWRHQRAAVSSALDALDAAQWTDDGMAWLEMCQYNLRSAAGPTVTVAGRGVLAPMLRQGTGHYDCALLRFTSSQWRALGNAEFMAVPTSDRIAAMRRVVQLQEQLFLIATLLPLHATDLKATQFAAACADDTLVTMLLHGLDATTTTTATASPLVDDTRVLPVYDRVALAAVLLPENDVFYAFLGHIVTETTVTQSPLAAIFLGFGDAGMRNMQGYVDATGDVQLAACLFGPYCRSRSSQNVGAVVWSGWHRTYCALLNDAGLFHERAKHDRAMRVVQQAQSQLEHDARDAAAAVGMAATASAAAAIVANTAAIAGKSPQPSSTASHHHHHHPHHHHTGGTTGGMAVGGRRAVAVTGGAGSNPSGAAVEVRCSCGQGMHDTAPLKQAPPSQTRTTGSAQLASVAPAPPPVKPLSLATSCPSDMCVAGAHQPLCAVCVDHIGQRGSGLVDGPGMWMAWCTSCLHGGHADHIAQWFRKHRKCPVDNCACECMDH